jgi:hypothetical protein
MKNRRNNAFGSDSGRFSRLPRAIVLLAITASLTTPAAALASPSEALKDCAKDSKLDKTYSQSDLAGALKQLPADVDEYTDCRDVLRRAQLGTGGGHGGSSSGGSSGSTGTTGTGGTGGPAPSAAEALASASPQERAAIQEAVAGGKEPVQVGTKTLSPTSLGVGDLAKTHGIPTPLVIVLILLGLASAGGLALARKSR